MSDALTLLSALGVGSVTAAYIGRSVAVMGHRQNWINSLRDDLSLLFKEMSNSRYEWFDLEDRGLSGSPLDLAKAVKAARERAMQYHFRVLLRLNLTENLHVSLKDQLETLMVLGGVTQDSKVLENAVDTARKVLKEEWAVAKYGPLTPLALRWKGLRRRAR